MRGRVPAMSGRIGAWNHRPRSPGPEQPGTGRLGSAVPVFRRRGGADLQMSLEFVQSTTSAPPPEALHRGLAGDGVLHWMWLTFHTWPESVAM